MKHTKGPWFSEDTAVFTKQGAYYIAETEIKSKSFAKHGAEARANAQLIAAAPEMLEALEMLLEYYGARDNQGLGQLAVARDKAREAIRKARGEP